MGQICFKSEWKGQPVEVLCGWDLPLERWFWSVLGEVDGEEVELAERGFGDFPKDKIRHALRVVWDLQDMGIVTPYFWTLVDELHRSCHYNKIVRMEVENAG